MKQKFIWDRRARDWVLASLYFAPKAASEKGPAIHKDYEPFVSPETGEVISGRRAYREHMKKHDLVCLGNERLPMRPKDHVPVPVADTLMRVYRDEAYRHQGVRDAMSRPRRLDFED